MDDRATKGSEDTMTTFREYPYYPSENLEDVKELLRQIINLRKDDISVISQITSSFISGRKVGKIPTGSADVDPAKDKVGDVNYTASFLYILIDNAGTPAWRRVALAAW